MLNLTALQIVLVILVMTVAAIVQGSTGFGLALVSLMPLLLISPTFVPGPLIVSSLLIALMTWRRDRASLDWKGLSGALLGRIPGAMAGAALLAHAPPKPLSIVIGCVILIAVGISAGGLHVSPTRRHVFLAGLLSGIMGTIAAVGGPPMALIYQKEEAARLRGTLAAYFAVGAVISIIALVPAGRFTTRELMASLILLPGLVLGFFLSSYANRFFHQSTLRLAVLMVAALGGITVVWSGLT